MDVGGTILVIYQRSLRVEESRDIGCRMRDLGDPYSWLDRCLCCNLVSMAENSAFYCHNTAGSTGSMTACILTFKLNKTSTISP